MSKPDTVAAAANRFALPGTKDDIEHGRQFTPKFDDNGLLAGIVCDAASGEILMLAWMNAEALALTIDSRIAHFWSRSRGEIWRKGDTSGNQLRVVEMRTDCDQDAVWMRVEIAGNGVACHTGARSCFYREIRLGGEPQAVDQAVELMPVKPRQP